jgi:hypothetical protein
MRWHATPDSAPAPPDARQTTNKEHTMTIKNAVFMLSAALALAVGASPTEANAIECFIDAPTSLAGRSCGTAALKATGVVRIVNDGKRATYKVKLTAGNNFATAVLFDSSGARTKDSNNMNCGTVNDVAPVNANFGTESGCTLRVLNSPTAMRLTIL